MILTNMRVVYKSLRLISALTAIIALSYITPFTYLFAHTISPTITAPIIRWDSSPSGPVNGITTFTPATGLLSMTGSIVSFTPGTIAGPLIVGGSVSIFATLSGVTVTPGLIHADFVTTGGANPNPTGFDVEILDSVGALALGGNFGGLTIDGIIGVNIGAGGAIFKPLGGYLLSDFLPGTGGIVHLEFNIVPVWSATSYTALWTSESKGDIGYVPKPVTPQLGARHRIVAQPYLHQ
ncbi:MAG TPA: hypothetical protein ACFYD6_01635 [Candidatus Brocadiia bacterium]|nr:hypothetical protein [Candidatus Brocadiales bacterium]